MWILIIAFIVVAYVAFFEVAPFLASFPDDKDYKMDIIEAYFRTFFWSFKRIYNSFDDIIPYKYIYVLAYKAMSTMDYYLVYIETCDCYDLYDLYGYVSDRIFFPFPKRLTFAQLKEMLSKTSTSVLGLYYKNGELRSDKDYSANSFKIVQAMLKRVIFNKEDKNLENINFVNNLLDWQYKDLLNDFLPWFLCRYFLKYPKN